MDKDRQRAEKALEFLADHDEAYAEAKTNVERAQFYLKRQEAIEYKSAEGNIPERQAIARLSESVVKAEKLLTDHLQRYETLKAQRATQTLIFEYWRSLNSARKQGLQV